MILFCFKGHLVDNLVEATLGTATNSQADNNQLRASSNNQLPPRSASVPPSLRPARVPATNNGLPRRDQSPEIIFSNIAPSHNTGHNNNAATFRPAMQNRQRHVSTDNVHTRIQHAENRNTMGSSEGRHLVNLLTDEDRIYSIINNQPQTTSDFRQPFVTPRRLQDVQSFMKLEPEPEKQAGTSNTQDKLSPEMVAQIIANALAQTKQLEESRDNTAAATTATSSNITGITTAPATQRSNHINATPFPIPEGWQQVRLPEHRWINGIPSKSRDPQFMVMHASILQQQRLSGITKINSLFCKENSFLKLLQKFLLDVTSAKSNIEVS